MLLGVGLTNLNYSHLIDRIGYLIIFISIFLLIKIVRKETNKT